MVGDRIEFPGVLKTSFMSSGLDGSTSSIRSWPLSVFRAVPGRFWLSHSSDNDIPCSNLYVTRDRPEPEDGLVTVSHGEVKAIPRKVA